MARQKNTPPIEQRKDETTEQQDAWAGKHQRIKATFYLNPQDIIAIDQMQIEAFKKFGKKPERSHLVSEAIQFLFMYDKQ